MQTTNRTEIQTGLLMMIAAMLLIPFTDAIAKGMSASLSGGQVTWGRFFFQTVILLPFMIGARSFRPKGRLWHQALRGILIATATLLFFSSLKHMPLADTVAIFFLEPFILIILSIVILREKVGWRRIAAVLVGFCGAMIIIQPSYAIFGIWALLPVGSAIAFAFYLISTRQLAAEETALTMQFYAGLFGCLYMSAMLFIGDQSAIDFLIPTMPDGFEWGMLFLCGAIATISHLLIVHAVNRVGTTMVAPFQYFEIISATLLGLLFFGDFPDLFTWVGIALIIGSGLYVFFRERQLAGAQIS